MTDIGRDTVIKAIDFTIAQGNAVQASVGPNQIVDWELRSLEQWRLIVQEQWPLDVSEKAKLNIGAVAAKNLADWTPAFANSLMQLDYALSHDGEHLDKVMSTGTAV